MARDILEHDARLCLCLEGVVQAELHRDAVKGPLEGFGGEVIGDGVLHTCRSLSSPARALDGPQARGPAHDEASIARKSAGKR